MPGRYSHSVVLAGYSSQGIINLPNDQRLEYAQSSPYTILKSSRKGNPSRTGQYEPHQRSQSAMNARSGRWTPVSPGVKNPLERVYIDSESDVVPVRSQSQQQQRSARGIPDYQPRLVDEHKHGRNSPSRSRPELASKPSGTPQLPLRSIQRDQQSNKVLTYRSKSPQSLSSRSTGIPEASSTIYGLTDHHDGQKGQGCRSKTVAISAVVTQPQRRMPEPPKIRRNPSSTTVQTQIFSPKRDNLYEPDFDDFSDTEEPQTSYFQPQQFIATMPADSVHRKVHLERKSDTPPPKKTATSPKQAHYSHTSPSSTESERDNTASTDSSPRILNSRSSTSSTGSGTDSYIQRNAKPVEMKKTRALSPTAQWGLPEIEEDAVFNPDIFAQDLDDENLRLEAPSPTFGQPTFGMISSGRDVTYESDDDSEGDAAFACPPDIGRYRNEDETALPDLLSKTKVEDDRAESPAMQPVNFKKGFLARLRSRRSWM